MEAFLFPSYLSPLGVRISVFPSPTDKTKHVRSDYRPIGTVITGYVPILVEPRRVRATSRSRQRRYRRSSERRKEESTKNDDTDKNEHLRSEYEWVGTILTSYVPSVVEPRRVGEAYVVQYGNSL